MFGRRDSVYIRHIDNPYRVVLYTADEEPQIIYDRHSDNQPVLFSVLQEFDVTIMPASREPYFYNFHWDEYKV